ncbi:YncE family protein [Pseudomonas fluorescens]|uniref:YncE family protein n=1 Tax=Pseudomonas fluorescens TaxID=294 RepID=UPI0012401D69|nr:YncE family protein [Pseudomonas fluorescens]VVM94689.1 hypothetical protein PS639_02961 [Pseudomonas fluorescens]
MNAQLPNPTLTAAAVVVIRDTIDQDDHRVRLASCEGFLPHKGLKVTIDDPRMSPGTELELLLDDQVIVRHIVTAAEPHAPFTVHVGPENLTKDLHELNYRVKRNNERSQTCDQPATVHIVIKSVNDLGLDDVTSHYAGSFARINIIYPQDKENACLLTKSADETVRFFRGVSNAFLIRNQYLYFVEINGRDIHVYNTHTLQRIAVQPTPFTNARIGGMSPDGVYTYVYDGNCTNIVRIKNDGEFYYIDLADVPISMVLSKSGDRLYVCTKSQLVVINTPSGEIIKRLPIIRIRGLALHPDGRHLYVFTFGSPGPITIINAYDTQSWESVSKNMLSGYKTEIAISPDGARLYATDSYYGDIFLIDTATNKTIKVSKSVSEPYCMGVSADGRHVYVGEHSKTTLWILDAESLDIVRGHEIMEKFVPIDLLGGPENTIYAIHF